MKAAAMALVLAAAWMAACTSGGDGGELTLEEYFARVQQISDEADAESADIEAEYEAVDFTNFSPELRDEYAAYFAAALEFFDGVIDELDAVQPPDEAADAHDEYVAKYRALSLEFSEVAGDLDGFETESDFNEAFLSGGFVDAVSDAEEACNGLQGLADDNNIAVDLECDS